jgi:hypothetical protein
VRLEGLGTLRELIPRTKGICYFIAVEGWVGLQCNWGVRISGAVKSTPPPFTWRGGSVEHLYFMFPGQKIKFVASLQRVWNLNLHSHGPEHGTVPFAPYSSLLLYNNDVSTTAALCLQEGKSANNTRKI